MDFQTYHPSQDRPIRREYQDKLERGPFVESLVRSLVRDEKDKDGKLTGRFATGYVVGLTGKWGLGKSSILQLLNMKLGSMDRVIVSYFNPWLFNGRDELMRGFFNGLREAMGRNTAEHGREIGAALERYWGAIDLAGHAVAAVADAHGGAGVFRKSWNGASKLIKGVLPKNDTLSAEAERKSLEKKIGDKKVAIVVLIDELDRVEDNEVRAVAQLIKAAGDIEGISYLVAYDPERVTDALGRGSGTERQASGGRYLEKIIQLPIPLRPLFAEDVDALLKAELALHKIAMPSGDEKNLRAILDQVKREIATPRDIKRLVGAFAVLEAATRGEIDPVDVLGYAWIMTRSPMLRELMAERFDELVVDPSEPVMISRLSRRLDEQKEHGSPVEVLGAAAELQSDLLKLLFPRFRGEESTEADGSRLFRRRNILRLLYLGNPPGAIPRSEIDRLWAVEDHAQLEIELQALQEAGTLADFLDRLDDFIAQLSAEGDTRFWPALARVLTRTSDWMSGSAPEFTRVDDAATVLMRLGLRDPRQNPRVQNAMAALIAGGDLAIAPWVLRKTMFAHGLTKHGAARGGNVIYTRDEALELMHSETARYRKAILDGTALRRLPNVEAIYVIANQGIWDNELRDAFTKQLSGREALSTAATLFVPPGYSADRQALTEMFDCDRVVEELNAVDFENPPLEPWIYDSVRRFAEAVGRDRHLNDDNDGSDTSA